MNSNNTSSDSGVKNATCPLASLVLLAAIHHPEDAKEILKPLGVGQFEIDKCTVENAELKDTIQRSAIAGALLDRKTFASLIRVRVGVKLIETEDPRHLATLVTAAAKLPPWVFGEEEPAVKPMGNSAHNGPYPGNTEEDEDISAMDMAEAIAEAKALITELEKPAKVKVL